MTVSTEEMPPYERRWWNRRWVSAHSGKVRFAKLKAAQAALDRQVASGRTLPGQMMVYGCRWTDVFQIPPAGKLHYHLGKPRIHK